MNDKDKKAFLEDLVAHKLRTRVSIEQANKISELAKLTADKKAAMEQGGDRMEYGRAAVAFGNSDQLRVGDWVLAIGNPFGLQQTVTAGIVSAKGRSINNGTYGNFIQTDASINPGNSGGPLFNLKGEMVGVNTAIFSRTGGNIGIGFAIPANMAKTSEGTAGP